VTGVIERNVSAFAAPPTPAVRLILSEPAPPGLTLNFGLVPLGMSKTSYVEIGNWGNQTFTVTQFAINADPPNQGLFVLGQAAPLPVPPQGSQFLGITFTPAAMVANGNHAVLAVVCDNPNQPNHPLQLLGFGIAPSIVVLPQALNFGNTSVSETAALSIYNVGAIALHVRGDSFQFLDAGGAVSRDFQLLEGSQPAAQSDLTLQPGLSRTFTIRFRPSTTGDRAATMTVRSDDPDHPMIQVRVTGTGV
jgi:hypothetical protein